MIPVLPLLLAGPQLSNRLEFGTTHQYRVVVTQTEYKGSGSEVTSKVVSEMPFVLRPAPGGKVDVTAGPLFARGRSVGRSRQTSATLGGPRLPSWLFVPLPGGSAKVGQKWKGPILVPAPLPAGMEATYTYRGNSKGLAKVGVFVKRGGNSQLTGAGDLFLHPQTGVPVQGRVLFKVAFVRPDMQDRTKLIVNSHMTVDCVVRPK